MEANNFKSFINERKKYLNNTNMITFSFINFNAINGKIDDIPLGSINWLAAKI